MWALTARLCCCVSHCQSNVRELGRTSSVRWQVCVSRKNTKAERVSAMCFGDYQRAGVTWTSRANVLSQRYSLAMCTKTLLVISALCFAACPRAGGPRHFDDTLCRIARRLPITCARCEDMFLPKFHWHQIQRTFQPTTLSLHASTTHV